MSTTNRQGSGASFGALRRPFSNMGIGGDAKIAKFIEGAKELIAESGQSESNGKYDVFAITDSRLLYPVVLVTDTRSINGKQAVFYATLILGNTCRRSQPTMDVEWRDHRGPSVLQLTPDEFYHSEDALVILTDAIFETIKTHTGITDKNAFRNCGEFVAPSIPGQEDACQDKRFIGAWLYTLVNSTYSTYLNLLKATNQLQNPEDYFFNIELLKGSPSTNISYNGSQLYGLSGEPIRRDLTITLSNVISSTGASAFVSDVGKEIVKVSGYIDTTWNGNSASGSNENRYLSQFYQSQPQKQYEPVYTPMAIITQFNNCVEDDVPPTLEVMLAGIIAFSMVREPAIWQRTYDPNFIGADTPYNIAATIEETGLVVPEGEDIDFHDYIDAAWIKSPVIAIDIDRNGSNYWALEPFVDRSAKANNEIIEACDNFLRGNFKKYWNPADPIVVRSYNLQGGYYQSGKEIRDIREIDDYIYSLNVLMGDIKSKPDGRLDFDALFDSLNPNWQNYTLAQRLVTRFNILNNMANNSFVPTGEIERVVLNPALINALTAGAMDAGVLISTANLNIEDNARERRGLRLSGYAYNPTENIFVSSQQNNYRR